jgi:hypothetical protein
MSIGMLGGCLIALPPQSLMVFNASMWNELSALSGKISGARTVLSTPPRPSPLRTGVANMADLKSSKISDPQFRIERARRARMARFGQLSPADRFWQSVHKSDGCWEWRGHRNHRGYGEITVDTRHVKAHRFSWALHHGAIPAGVVVCHHCDNRACVRPDHLFLGTMRDNMLDAKRKGRAYQPGQHGTQGPDGRWQKKQ